MIIFLYGIFAYLVGLFGLTYFILFLGGWDFLPLHIHSKTPGDSLQAWLINCALMLLFALQHSVMARPRFKQWLTRMMPIAAERSTYVLLSGLVMLIMCYYWQPIAGYLWQVDQGVIYTLLVAGYLFGWTFAMIATFLINHFELMGLQQVYLHLKQLPKPDAHFTERWFYRMVRHPLQLGVLMGIWLTPTMSMGHFSLALTMTVYIVIGLQFEEKDLAATLGDSYRDYQRRVPMLIPWTKRK